MRKRNNRQLSENELSRVRGGDCYSLGPVALEVVATDLSVGECTVGKVTCTGVLSKTGDTFSCYGTTSM